jgi:hypothetical protein
MTALGSKAGILEVFCCTRVSCVYARPDDVYHTVKRQDLQELRVVGVKERVRH